MSSLEEDFIAALYVNTFLSITFFYFSQQKRCPNPLLLVTDLFIHSYQSGTFKVRYLFLIIDNYNLFLFESQRGSLLYVLQGGAGYFLLSSQRVEYN